MVKLQPWVPVVVGMVGFVVGVWLVAGRAWGAATLAAVSLALIVLGLAWAREVG